MYINFQWKLITNDSVSVLKKPNFMIWWTKRAERERLQSCDSLVIIIINQSTISFLILYIYAPVIFNLWRHWWRYYVRPVDKQKTNSDSSGWDYFWEQRHIQDPIKLNCHVINLASSLCNSSSSRANMERFPFTFNETVQKKKKHISWHQEETCRQMLLQHLSLFM